MAKRSASQRIGDRAEHLVQGVFLDAPNWICRTQSHDFGVDLEAELSETIDGIETMSGALLKLQVKGTVKPLKRDRCYQIRIKTDYLRYANQFNVPVILLLVNTNNEDIYYLWLQEYLIGREDTFGDSKSVLVSVPDSNVLRNSLEDKLPEIALGITKASQLMAVQKLFEVFSSKYDHKALEFASGLLDHLDNSAHLSIFDSTIEKLIKRGPHLSRVGSQEFGKILLDLTRRFGSKLSAEQVFKMVVRGESYSWAGLDGLTGLYDGFPDHAKSLELALLFDEAELYELSWYCRFREAHAHLNTVEIWLKITDLDTEFPTDIGVLHIPDDARDFCYLKWPNRSDMVYLQCLRPLEGIAESG